MTTEMVADNTVTARVVEIDGIPMSALCAEVEQPRAVLVAAHGGATTSRYFDLAGRPWLSLLRVGAQLGFTVVAVDRPGYGASGPQHKAFDDPARRVDACYALIDALLGSGARGAGVFLMAHSAGCELAVRMAADPRGAELLGVELAGTGLHTHAEAQRRMKQVRQTGNAAVVTELLWHPPDSFPPDIIGGWTLASRSPRYETAVVDDWPETFRRFAGQIAVPVRFTSAEYEQFWLTDPTAVAEIAALFTAAPRFVGYTQSGTGHNLSVGFAAAAYHLSVLSFAEECVLRRIGQAPR
jgi:alpha-beta hydrolase superfamily lysophospholipase